MRKELMNNLGLKILAFLAAVTLWFLVVNIDNPVTDRTFTDIPVTVVNDDIVTASNRTYQILDGTQQVNVTVTATRQELSRITADDIHAVADMRELTLGTQVPIQVTIEGHSYEEAYSTPRNLQVKIEEEARNNFPITPTTIGTVREGYVIGNLRADPEGVTIRGPKSVLNSINRVCAEVDVSGLSENAELEANLILYDVNNNVIDQTLLVNNLGDEGVSVEVELYQTKNVPIDIDTSGISAAEGYSIGEISCEPQEVLLSGDEDAMKELDEIQIPESELELAGLTERTERTVDITEYLPDGRDTGRSKRQQRRSDDPGQPAGSPGIRSVHQLHRSQQPGQLPGSKLRDHRRSGTTDPGTGRNPSEPDTGKEGIYRSEELHQHRHLYCAAERRSAGRLYTGKRSRCRDHSAAEVKQHRRRERQE